MRTITITRSKNLPDCTAADLAAYYKLQGYDKFYAWDCFIKDRSLQPELDSGEFYRVFEYVTPAHLPAITETIEFYPNTLDKLTDPPHEVMMIADAGGVYQLIWDNGMTGSYPPCIPPDPARFEPMGEK